MKVGVTGGFGFVGSHLVERLLRHGYSVAAIDDLSNGSLANVKSDPAFSCTIGSIHDESALNRALGDVDAVVHLAATGSVVKSVEDPLPGAVNNVVGTVKVLDLCRKRGIKRLVYASSCGVYGDAAPLPFREEYEPKPKSPYHASKVAAEIYCRAFEQSYDLMPFILRFTNIYGSRRSLGAQKGAVLTFVEAALRNKDIVIYGDGEQSRDLVHVSDAARAVMMALDHPELDGVFNIGTGVATTMNRLAEEVINATSSTSNVIHEPARGGELKASVADISKARSLLDYEPRTSLPEGLKEVVGWALPVFLGARQNL